MKRITFGGWEAPEAFNPDRQQALAKTFLDLKEPDVPSVDLLDMEAPALADNLVILDDSDEESGDDTSDDNKEDDDTKRSKRA